VTIAIATSSSLEALSVKLTRSIARQDTILDKDSVHFPYGTISYSIPSNQYLRNSLSSGRVSCVPFQRTETRLFSISGAEPFTNWIWLLLPPTLSGYVYFCITPAQSLSLVLYDVFYEYILH